MLRNCPLKSRGTQPVVHPTLEVLTATIMKMEIPGFSETLVTYQTGRCCVPQENSLLMAILWFMAPRKL